MLFAGHADLVAALEAELARRTVGRPLPVCPQQLQVHVDGTLTSLTLLIVDPDGRRVERAAPSATTAATFIETWARFDIDGSLLPVAVTYPSSPDLESPRPLVTARDEAHPASVRRPQMFLTGLETAVASDRSVWLAVDAAMFLPFGALLLGPMVRVSRDLEVSGQSRERASSRTNSELLLAAAWRIERPSWALMPIAAIGVAWLHVGGGQVDETTRDREAPENNLGGVRASLGLVLSLPVRGQTGLSFSLSEEVSPSAHTGVVAGGGRTLAGEPRAYFQAGLGVLFGS